MNAYEQTREALNKIYMLAQAVCDDRDEPTLVRHHGNRIERLVNAAIALPRRNCDVGTGDEQQERFNRFCKRCEDGCPLAECEKIVECAIKWAQIPYEQEGARE